MLDADGICNVELEKEFRDVCYSVLSKWCKTIPAELVYAAWFSTHSKTAKTLTELGKHKPLDMVFIDETVGEILYDYFIPEEIEPNNVHDFLEENGIHNVFTRKKMANSLTMLSQCLVIHLTQSILTTELTMNVDQIFCLCYVI